MGTQQTKTVKAPKGITVTVEYGPNIDRQKAALVALIDAARNRRGVKPFGRSGVETFSREIEGSRSAP